MSEEKQTISLTEVQWVYTCGPENVVRVVISQRQDGPFADNKIGEKGHYYVSCEKYDVSTCEWKFIEGSTSYKGYGSFVEAEKELVHRARKYAWSLEDWTGKKK